MNTTYFSPIKNLNTGDTISGILNTAGANYTVIDLQCMSRDVDLGDILQLKGGPEYIVVSKHSYATVTGSYVSVDCLYLNQPIVITRNGNQIHDTDYIQVHAAPQMFADNLTSTLADAAAATRGPLYRTRKSLEALQDVTQYLASDDNLHQLITDRRNNYDSYTRVLIKRGSGVAVGDIIKLPRIADPVTVASVDRTSLAGLEVVLCIKEG